MTSLSSRETSLWFVLLVVAILLPGVAEADEFRLLPSIAQTLQYNDNVFVDPSHQIHDYISTTTGGLELFESTERLTLNAMTQLSQNLYKDNTSLNSTDGLGNGNIRYSLTPQLALSAAGSYSRTAQPDRELLTTGLALNGVREDSTRYHAEGDYSLTEKTLASLIYDHGSDHYQSSLFSDLTYDTGTLSFTHDLSAYLPQAKGTLMTSYTHYTVTGADIDNYEATAGFGYSLQEKWSIQVAAGLRRTESSFETFVPTGFVVLTPFGPVGVVRGFAEQTQRSSGWGGVGQAALSYKGEVTNGSFTASRDIAPASGQNGTVERTSVTASVDRRLSYDFHGYFDAGYFINKSNSAQFSLTPIDFETLNFSPRIRYEFGRERSEGMQSLRDMYLEASYTYTRLEDKIAQTTAYRSLFLIRFFAQHAVLE